MSDIVPAILPQSRADLEDKLARLDGVASHIQIDTVDGRFVGPATWPFRKGSWDADEFCGDAIPHLGSFHFEVDLMVENAATVAGAWIDAGASRVVFHATSSQHVLDDIRQVQMKYGHDTSFDVGLLSLGLALVPGSDLVLLQPFLPYINFVQFMGIKKIGLQAQPFESTVLEKIRQCRARYPELPVQVDGGVTLENAPRLLELGVSRLVIGSGIWKAADPRAQYQRFAQLREQYG
jgi:ribulose-phosphate 3-epimerase